MDRHWSAPTGSQGAGQLHLYNSLVDDKVPFVPASGPASKNLTWYGCGPTVYDSAHLGHARNYVSFDIVRRVLEDYFGFNITCIMNVTDIDDKIILKARRNHLLKEYAASINSLQQVQQDANAAVQAAIEKQQKKVDKAEAELAAAEARVKEDFENELKNEQLKLSQAQQAMAGLQQQGLSSEQVLSVAGDYIAQQLDEQKGHEVTEHSIYQAHASKYEGEFMEDLDALGCRRPTAMPRVSEYVPDIVAYVQRIIDNGMAYECSGSVYFDIAKFCSSGHVYAKLEPSKRNAAALASEGEANFSSSEKRSPMDFALWKASKPGEPSWESPWGKGRPGWHIECSAMASQLAGSKLDIHTGGHDLRFPHHDNELAQAEAYYHCDGCHQWVNYFLHVGKLTIAGLKMSKSLKNYITIREALKTYSARQLRLMFLLQPWHKPMSYGEQCVQEMRAKEAMLRNFFQNVEAATRDSNVSSRPLRMQPDDTELLKQIQEAQQQVHDALLDNIDTPRAMEALAGLIRNVNVYLAARQGGSAAAEPNPLLLQQAAGYVSRILSSFGLIQGAADKLGWLAEGAAAGSSGSSGNTTQLLDMLAALRDEVRSLVRSKAEPQQILDACGKVSGSASQQNSKSLEERVAEALLTFQQDISGLAAAGDSKAMLTACDALRDETLVEMGIRLEDRPDGKAVWKLDDPEVLRAEQAARLQAAAEAQRKKLAGALDRKAKELDKLAKLAELPAPQVALADKYKFDAAGEPVADKEGAALEGKALDKAKKDLDKARKVREPLSKALEKDPAALDKLRAEVEELQQQLAALEVAK